MLPLALRGTFSSRLTFCLNCPLHWLRFALGFPSKQPLTTSFRMENFRSFTGAEEELKTTEIYPSTDPVFARFAGRRSVVHSTKGIVASTQPLACRAGIKVLEQGGNAAVSRDLTFEESSTKSFSTLGCRRCHRCCAEHN